MYRLISPFEGNETSWMIVSEDKTEAFVIYFRVLASANSPVRWLKLKGLDPSRRYSISRNEGRHGGDELMYAGLKVPYLNGDFQSVVWRLSAK